MYVQIYLSIYSPVDGFGFDPPPGRGARHVRGLLGVRTGSWTGPPREGKGSKGTLKPNLCMAGRGARDVFGLLIGGAHGRDGQHGRHLLLEPGASSSSLLSLRVLEGP